MTEGWARYRRKRQGEDRPQAGLVIFQPKRTLMHAGNSGCEAETKAEAGTRARRFQPHEALQHVAPLGLGNTRPAIGDLDPHLAVLTLRRDGDRSSGGV